MAEDEDQVEGEDQAEDGSQGAEDGGMPAALLEELSQIMAAQDNSVSPSSEIDELETIAQKMDSRSDQDDLAGLPISPISDDPEDGVVPGPKNPSKKAVSRLVNVRSRAYDLSDSGDADSYAKEIELIFNPESKRVLAAPEMPPTILLDPTAPKGYRVVVVLTTADTDILVIKNPDYDLIERSKLKRGGT